MTTVKIFHWLISDWLRSEASILSIVFLFGCEVSKGPFVRCFILTKPEKYHSCCSQGHVMFSLIKLHRCEEGRALSPY